MKKLLTILLILALLLPAAAWAEGLTDLEKEYVGVWVMYATHGSAVYNYSLTFMEDGYVFFHTMRIIGGKVYNEATTRGTWGEFAGGILFSAAGESMAGDITEEDGYLQTMRLSDKTGAGTYFRCPDMGYTFQ